GLAIAVSVMLAFLRKEMPPIGAQVAMAFVVVALLYLMRPLVEMVDVFVELAGNANVRPVYLIVVLKAVGIAYITSIGAELSRSAGEGAIGAIVELAGKVFILSLAVPVVAALLDVLVRLLPG